MSSLRGEPRSARDRFPRVLRAMSVPGGSFSEFDSWPGSQDPSTFDPDELEHVPGAHRKRVQQPEAKPYRTPHGLIPRTPDDEVLADGRAEVGPARRDERTLPQLKRVD